MADAPDMMQVNNVSKAFGEDWEREMVIENLSLKIRRNQLTAIVGPSGCGKSTVVNLLAGFEKPDSGQILLDGRPVTGPSKDTLVVFQETALMPWLTTYQNVTFGPKLRGDIPRDQLKEAADSIIETVGLKEFRDKYPLQLSGGMQRRAELARALINQPLVMVMDEPFRGLDAMTRQLMQEFYMRLCEQEARTNVFVTSELEEAIILADSLVVLSNRPATVREVVQIDLPRPRNLEMLSSSQAYEYKRHAMEMLHEEALKSFKGVGSSSDFLESYSRRP
ncbi:MAG: ABC transporter ATP-binding protein [Acidiferrobacteraceae bacterium]|nr:ABC transporter ATP-binding protein [Acidiferrobacteraceae bacterium]MBT3640002.1 ABC transporter ATP-binding protein [Acidiferrobacteraceae bacterium]MBT3769146.1 ABC transporter ATP-binding protein [Acidiferrobacteraceae bacterium]MBT3972612.1 ABC transporter ATP-binding protein [Acidiferrobacteraceae bacterium]MBT4395145.1 ABC transporter ATP-binding protein [Acidiferrobacteraceae bacterium]